MISVKEAHDIIDNNTFVIDKEYISINDVNKHQKESYEKRWLEEMKVGQMTNQADLFRHSKANLETMRKEKNG